MRELQIPHLSVDLLDRLILDTCELEDLAERLIQSLDLAGLDAVPRGPVAVQLMDLLYRLKQASGVLHSVSGHQIKSMAFALSNDLAGDNKPDRPHRNRELIGAVEVGDPVTRRGRHR